MTIFQQVFEGFVDDDDYKDLGNGLHFVPVEVEGMVDWAGKADVLDKGLEKLDILGYKIIHKISYEQGLAGCYYLYIFREPLL